jgi:uncharacterized phage protein (TIGR02220 family)
MVSMTLTHEIEKCTKCENLEDDRLGTDEKPCVKFQVETKWKPKNGINVLFIAESPPWNGKQRYFYNPDIVEKRTNLRKEVLRHLNLKTLEEFRDNGYFLIDAIKCRLNKKEKKNVPTQVLQNCSAKFLQREITQLKPQTIFVLGNSAKRALQTLPKFWELKEQKVTGKYDKKTSHVILCVYPGGQTRKYKNEINHAFSKIHPTQAKTRAHSIH